MERTKLVAPGKHRHTLIYGLGGFRVEPVLPEVRFSPLSVLSGCTLFPHERTVYTSTLSISFLSSRTCIEVYIKCKRSRSTLFVVNGREARNLHRPNRSDKGLA